MTIELDLIQTSAVALAVLFIGYLLNYLIPFLKNNNIPEPVVGGIAFAALSTMAYSWGGISFNFDMSLKMPLMLVFFTTVGLGANLKLLKQGGPKLVIFLVITTCYLFVQDATGVAFAYLQTQGFDNVRILKATYTELMAELLPCKLRKLLQNKV